MRESRHEAPLDEPVSHMCPNAASVSIEAGRWACYYHASTLFENWGEVTRKVRDMIPASLNWSRSDKVEYEAGQEEKRRANLTLRKPYAGIV